MDRIPEQPPRSDCGDGLLHRPDSVVWDSLLFLRHCARSAAGTALQRDPASTGAWVSQQLRETFPYESALGYLIFDRGTNFNLEVINTVRSFGIQPKRTSFRSPWQNGVAERWVSSCRRDLINHVIVLNERHLKRLMSEYVHYYHEDRTHLALEKRTPGGREATKRSNATCKVQIHAKTGWLAPPLRPGCLSPRRACEN
jgi:transposase InsO family protein